MTANPKLTARDLTESQSYTRRMLAAPSSFSGSLAELATNFVVPNLVTPQMVETFHNLLVDYLAGVHPTFLVRTLSDTVRSQHYHTDSGEHFKATDNAPAWWIHFALFHEIALPADSFGSIIETIPTHLFEVAAQIPASVSSARWHVAHIFAVKDRNTDYRTWHRDDLVRRCVRNIHPCNYFFIPKTDWRLWGGNERVISYFAGLYETRYASVWPEFLSLAGGDLKRRKKETGAIEYHIAEESVAHLATRGKTVSLDGVDKRRVGKPVVAYNASRLAFKADLIEPLESSLKFRIITPQGTFEMSKAEFYTAFPNVVESKSYRERRLYHYPTIPNAALKFRISD